MTTICVYRPVRLAALIIFILWSMGKVPYGALCWIIPLVMDFLEMTMKYFKKS